MTVYLLHFANRHLDFRLAELDALLEMAGCEPCEAYDREAVDIQSPFMKVNLNQDKRRTLELLLQRSVLLKGVIEFYGEGTSIDACAKRVQSLSEGALRQYLDPAKSFSLEVHGYGKRMSMEEQAAFRRHFSFLDFRGPVCLEQPDVTFRIGVEFPRPDEQTRAESCQQKEIGGSTSSACASNSIDNKVGPRRSAAERVFVPQIPGDVVPKRVFFGVDVGKTQRRIVQLHTLKQRQYLGPTSMDHELSLVMANVAQVKPGGQVLDPFVGTGSVLVACAHFGALCFGTDIDIRVLHGNGLKDVYANFEQYGLPRPELVRSDSSRFHDHFRTSIDGSFQAIITDPPYGMRAGARKSGSRSGQAKPVSEKQRALHIPQTKPYAVVDLVFDLLDMAALCLCLYGRLVYILPCGYDFDEARHLPRHPCLRRIATCEQCLTRKLARRMVVMEKVEAYDPSRRKEYRDRSYLPVLEPTEFPYGGNRDKLKSPGREKREDVLCKGEKRLLNMVPSQRKRYKQDKKLS